MQKILTSDKTIQELKKKIGMMVSFSKEDEEMIKESQASVAAVPDQPLEK